MIFTGYPWHHIFNLRYHFLHLRYEMVLHIHIFQIYSTPTALPAPLDPQGSHL